MGKKPKDISECKHPNSRKTIAFVKQMKKESNREKAKLGTAIKQNLIAERISWFREQLTALRQAENITTCAPEHISAMIELYLTRFDEELEQIKLKRSIGMRKNNRQHAGREDVIKMTLQRETQEYNTCGLEIPDFTNALNVDTVCKWKGELRFLQNIKLKRFSKQALNTGTKK